MLDAKMLRWHPTQPIFHWQLLGFASGKNAKKFASPNAEYTNMLVSLR